ncbi:hypothetical protein [Longilinea arvoryzae]|nr:hypothetical protein [Longilinea arvoryzae]
MGATIAVALLTNMAWGFLAGLAVHYLIQSILKRKKHPEGQPPAIPPG